MAAVLTGEHKAQGLSQSAVGRMSGISQTQVSDYLRGDKAMDTDELHAVSLALGMTVTEVVTAAEDSLAGH